ncbi:MAG TPA: hypothetical protein VF412_04050 [Bdellovibrio sp.]
MTVQASTAVLAKKVRTGRMVLMFYVITFLSVEILRHSLNQ